MIRHIYAKLPIILCEGAKKNKIISTHKFNNAEP